MRKHTQYFCGGSLFSFFQSSKNQTHQIGLRV
jgi:hypothetical protein